MQKRLVVVGSVMFVASVVLYGIGRVDGVTDIIGTDASAAFAFAAWPGLVPGATQDAIDIVSALSDSAMLLATGVALIALAAGVRRQTP
jgi:hypothetical protein